MTAIKTETVTFRIQPELKTWLRQMAEHEHRSLANMLEVMIRDYLGHLIDRARRELSDEDVATISRTYHAWRGETDAGAYADVPGFCKSATLEEIRGHGHVLTPVRHGGAVTSKRCA